MKGREKDGRNKFIDIECNANAIVFFSFFNFIFQFFKGQWIVSALASLSCPQLLCCTVLAYCGK